MAMMKAYQFTQPTTGLQYTEVQVPTPLADQVLVEVCATGLCHTDCNIISGKDNTFFWKRPIILGHEIAGVVTSIGSKVSKFKIGDRVVSIIGTQHPITFHDVTTSAGIGYDGGFAQFAVLYESKVLPIPEGVPYGAAAIATDAIATAYHAVVVAGQVKPTSRVAVVGLGGLGLSAAQFATKIGAKVYGIELDSQKYAAAASLGVHTCAKGFESFPGIRHDVVLDFAGAGTTTAAAVRNVVPCGKVVLVGLSKKETTIDTHEFIAYGVTLVGAAGSSIDEVEICLQMLAKGEFAPLVQEIPFSGLKEGLHKLASGNVLGRLFADPRKL